MHFIRYGSCGHVIAQCRCPSKDKTVERVDTVCADCAANPSGQHVSWAPPSEDGFSTAAESAAYAVGYGRGILKGRTQGLTDLYAMAGVRLRGAEFEAFMRVMREVDALYRGETPPVAVQ
jgi:hypothetical protein